MSAVNATVSCHEILLTRNQEVQRLIGCIRDALGELADAEADAACPIPSTSAGVSSDGIVVLLCRLRAELRRGQSAPTLEPLLPYSAQDRALGVAQSPADRELPLATLEEIIELAFSSGRRVCGWYDIESRFSRFAVSLRTQLDRDGEYLGHLPARRKTVVRATADGDSPANLSFE